MRVTTNTPNFHLLEDTTMITLRQSPFDLFERLEQQLSQAERVPAADIHDTAEAYVISLELPGVDKSTIDVQATDRSISVTAERRRPDNAEDADTALLSEFRYGSWSRSFRFPQGLNREQLQASYRDGVLTIRAGKVNSHTAVAVQVES